MSKVGLDVIGDIHGHAGKLKQLLCSLGYTERNGVWQHLSRRAVFIGDLIDRGPEQLETVRIVQRMTQGGYAYIVMGNHEYNAVCWATEHRTNPDGHLRPRTGLVGERNFKQHQRFLEEAGNDTLLHAEIIDWFRTIPLWLELDGARFIHACWDTASMAHVKQRLNGNAVLTDDVLHLSSQKGHADYTAIECLLKGPEVELPDGYGYIDKDGVPRRTARYAWWRHDAHTYRNGAIIPEGTLGEDGQTHRVLPDTQIPEPPAGLYSDEIPLFVGHYWQSGTTQLLAPRVACVDYSAGKGGPLVCYQWDGENLLDAAKFVSQQ